MKLSVFHKLFALTMGVAFAVLAVSALTFLLTATPVMVRGLGEEALRLAQSGASSLSFEQYESALDRRPGSEDIWTALVARLNGLQVQFGPSGAENIYVLAPLDGSIYVLADPTGDDPAYAVQDTVNVALKMHILETGAAAATPASYTDEWGTWISGYAPLTATDGRVVALLGADLPLGAFPLINDIVARTLAFSLVPALALALFASVLASRRLTRPVREIIEGLARVRQGDFSAELVVDTNDEFGEMARAYNSMTRELAEKERLRAMFAQSVSEEVAEKMLSGEITTRGELREVTVLFADIRGFTELTETMAARSVIEMLNEYFSALMPCVNAHGGVVDKLVGDEIFAVFGAPAELEDDALSAVRTGLDMRAALKRLNEERLGRGEQALAFGVGISTGAVVAGNLGTERRLNYTVLGNTVNIGARLCSHAEPGQILIGGSTYLRVKRSVEVSPLPPLQVKGITFPLDVFQVTSLTEAVDV